MSDTIADRVRRYVLDGGDEDLRRLLGVAHVSADMARSAFLRIGVQDGWKTIECGCGPIGGLAADPGISESQHFASAFPVGEFDALALLLRFDIGNVGRFALRVEQLRYDANHARGIEDVNDGFVVILSDLDCGVRG